MGRGLSGRSARVEFDRKEAQVDLRLPRAPLVAVKARAEARGISYAHFVRESLERALAG